MTSPLHPVEAALRTAALAYPDATEAFPWGERAFKVRGKAFLFMRATDDEVSMSFKLPASSAAALLLPFAEPTGYGLGKSGWVTAKFAGKRKAPLSLLKEWIDESYRAVAPKKLSALLDAAPPAKKPRTPASKRVRSAPRR